MHSRLETNVYTQAGPAALLEFGKCQCVHQDFVISGK